MYKICAACWLVFALALGDVRAEPVFAVDSRGQTLRMSAPAKRVVSLAPSHTEWVFALGAGARLVGRTPQCDAPAAARAAPPIGNLFPPDYEAIVAARPDLVLMLAGSDAARERLEALGIPVFVWQPATLAEVYAGAAGLARLLGVDSGPAVSALRAQIAAVKPSASGRTVTFVTWPTPVRIAGPQTFIADLVRQAGGRLSTVADAGDWPLVSLEQLVSTLNPDVLLVPEGLKLPAAWASLRAVQTQRICSVPGALLTRPSPRLGQTLARLVACL